MADFEKHIVALYGNEGKDWLEKIPKIIKTCEEKLQIQVFAPYELSYNYVAPIVRADGSKAVIKIGFPKDKEFATHLHALEEFDGNGIIKLLEYRSHDAFVLLEICIPGTNLKKIKNNKEQTEIAAGVMQKFWKKIPHTNKFPTIADWGKGFARYRNKFRKSGPIPLDQVRHAEIMYKKLLQTSSENYLLHGDLHHENILLSERGWLAIDPKGVIGERAYELGCFLRNPYPELIKYPNAKEIIKERILIFSKMLGIDPKRIGRWAFAQCILSAIWVAEERGQYIDYYLSLAELLKE